MRSRQIYAVYRGEQNLTDGTAEEIAKFLGLKVKTVRNLALGKRAHEKGQRLVVVKLGKEKGVGDEQGSSRG
ncbi:MAG: hypothetical protein SOW21_04275 [[Actinobacillus] rossii]|uniref:Uncharacterized protein n=1 Tax=[Actinobacillus] rossii TaxID=123820 RepID=A0A380TUS3_9PAST|nr:hypothetical protein [[Actinobacillus] rossii]SUT91502.1 Uncharacterised protein [[Actinobacillus] rossii]SUT94259.1 Uncharacterised protein [[Actinobacillus] rossii]